MRLSLLLLLLLSGCDFLLSGTVSEEFLLLNHSSHEITVRYATEAFPDSALRVRPGQSARLYAREAGGARRGIKDRPSFAERMHALTVTSGDSLAYSRDPLDPSHWNAGWDNFPGAIYWSYTLILKDSLLVRPLAP